MLALTSGLGLHGLARSCTARSRGSLAGPHTRALTQLAHRASAVGVALALVLLVSAPLGHTASVDPGAAGARQCSSRAAQASASSLPLEDQIKEKVAQNPVLVFSKSWCPYCASVKSLFKSLGIKHKVIELDQTADGEDVQAALVGISGSRTVPQVFIGGSFVGGADDTQRNHRSGKLEELLSAAGVEVDSNADIVS